MEQAKSSILKVWKLILRELGMLHNMTELVSARIGI